MHFLTVFFLYSSLLFSILGAGQDLHQKSTPANRTSEHKKRPELTEEAEKLAADALLTRILESFKRESAEPYPGPTPEFSGEELTKLMPQLIRFPDLLKTRTPDILSALQSIRRGCSIPVATCLELLAVTVNPEHIPIFEAHLKSCSPSGRDCFEAAQGLSLLYKAHPDLVTAERKKVLFNILNSTGYEDLTRLYLRQTLPASLARELDEQVFEWKKENRPPQALALAEKTVGQSAEGTVKHDQRDIANRALAFQYLMVSDRPRANLRADIHSFFEKVIASASEKPKIRELEEGLLNPSSKEKLEEFIQRISQSPPGLGLRIHDGIQLENLISSAQKSGLELDPRLVSSIRDLTQKQFEVIWNSGRPLVKLGGDSALSNYAQSALILSYGNRPLDTVGREALDSLESLRGEINPHTGKPQFYNYTSEAYRKDATEASSAGRALTGHLALYQRSEDSKKAERAQELLQATRNFDTHFSQLFEESNFMRTHDRNPKGEGMADYYGFANIPYQADALIQLSRDPSLTGSQKVEVRRLAVKTTNRILNRVKTDGRFSDNSAYNFLMGIALEKLTQQFSVGR